MIELLEAAQSLRESWSEAEEPDEESEEESDDEQEDELGSRVLEAFENDPILAARAVEIQSDDTTILLHGRVHSAREVQHAVTIARPCTPLPLRSSVPSMSKSTRRERFKRPAAEGTGRVYGSCGLMDGCMWDAAGRHVAHPRCHTIGPPGSASRGFGPVPCRS